jgi:hypothetical protein
MSERNGDKARFHRVRKRKLRHRQRTRAFMARLPKRTDEETSGALDDAIAEPSSLHTIRHTGDARSKRSG